MQMHYWIDDEHDDDDDDDAEWIFHEWVKKHRRVEVPWWRHVMVIIVGGDCFN